jgi:hypothetical protein
MSLRSIVATAVVGAGCVVFGAGPALAGEITGNGTLKTVHGNSPCAFSGQEDLQWFTDDSDQTPLADPVRGVPQHSQNWGHTEGRDGGANETNAFGFEWGCNARDFGLKN